MDRWKTTALLAMGMLAGQLYATACSGVGAKLGTDTSVALATPSGTSGTMTPTSGSFRAGRAVFELRYDADGDNCSKTANERHEDDPLFEEISVDNDGILNSYGELNNDDKIFNSDFDCDCPPGFTRVGTPPSSDNAIVCLED
jgi:hypothetical protein